MLYFTTGDQNVPENSQKMTEQAGKIHRIDRDGSSPSDNLGMQDGPGGNLDSIWASGLRNPFRADWDVASGVYLIGDVGSNAGEGAWEEINLGLAGKNYGWPRCEGACGAEAQFATTCKCQASVPEAERYETGVVNYRHSEFENRGCVVAGAFYNPAWGDAGQFPQQYRGKYFFADHTIRMIFYVDVVDGKVQNAMHEFYDLGTGSPYAGRLVALRVGPNNALYYIDYNQNSIRQISYDDMSSGKEPPKIDIFVASPLTSQHDKLVVTFFLEVINSNDFETERTFVFGDGTTATVSSLTGSTIQHTYDNPGRYEASAIVTDSIHTIRSSLVEITVGLRPVAKIVSPVDGSSFHAGENLSLKGLALDLQGLPFLGCELEWELSQKHVNHFHPFLDGLVGDNVTFVIPTAGHEFYGDVAFEIRLTVTTHDGLISTDTIIIEPQEIDVKFASSLPNVPISIVGVPYSTPHVHDILVGFNVSISAPSTVCIASEEAAFSHWEYPIAKIGKKCLTDFMFLPMNMVGHERTEEPDIEACQARCASVDDCAYFTFWSLESGCHLADAMAIKSAVKWQKIVSGDIDCRNEPNADLTPSVGTIASNEMTVIGSPTILLYTAVYATKIHGTGGPVACGQISEPERVPEIDLEPSTPNPTHKPTTAKAPKIVPTDQAQSQATIETAANRVCNFTFAVIDKRGHRKQELKSFKKVKQAASCADKCLANDACGGYSYCEKKKKCKTYTSKGVSTKKLKKAKKWITYVKSCSSPPEPPSAVITVPSTGVCYAAQQLSVEGIMYIGRGVDKIVKSISAATAKACGGICTRTSGCNHFAFNADESSCKVFKAVYASKGANEGQLKLVADGSGLWDGYILDITWAACQGIQGVKVPVIQDVKQVV
jgi:hypothetical protein